MKLEGLLKIETELGIKLPESYKTYMLSNPYGDKVMYDIICESLFDDPEDLIKINKRLRKNGLQKNEWLPNLFAIAYYDGEYVFIRTDTEEETVYLANRGAFKYCPNDLSKNYYGKSIQSYIGPRILIQEMKRKQEHRIANNLPEAKVDVNEYLDIWDAMLKEKK